VPPFIEKLQKIHQKEKKMTTLYWDCFSGIAGNMAVGSLLDLGVDPEALRSVLSGIPFEEGKLDLLIEERTKSGFRCKYFNTIEEELGIGSEPGTPHTDDQHGRSLSEIRRILGGACLGPRVLKLALDCFQCLGEAEASIHGTSVEKIHFHEVGARDCIADIVGTAFCIDSLGITSIFVSPVNLGSGFIDCRHGHIPIPGPATALLLKGFQVFVEPGIIGELTTPTGAALLRGMGAVSGFPPEFAYGAVGAGCGSKEYKIPNFLRAFLGTSAPSGGLLDSVVILETNLDNVTGELLGHVVDRLMAAGALDVSIASIQMKKGRPGSLLTVICPPPLFLSLEECIFKELPTLGIRRRQSIRSVLERHPTEVQTRFGALAGKTVREIDGSARLVVEYEARRKKADDLSLPLRCVDELLLEDASRDRGKSE